MDEYINRELAIKALSRGEGCGNVCRRAIERIPAADVAPVRHGRWIDLGDNYWERGCTSTRYKCSECGRRAGQKQAKLYHYCPNCGAKMDLEG